EKKVKAAKKNTEELKKKETGTTKSNNNLIVEISNQAVNYNSSTGKYYFEFNINVRSNTTTTFLDNVGIHLNYSITAFGSNIVANNKINVSLNSILFDPTTYEYENRVVDYSSNILNLGIGTIYGASLYRTPLFTSSINLFHVQIELNNNLNGTFTAISFTDVANMANLSLYSNSSNADFFDIYGYDNTTYVQPSTISISTPVKPYISTNLSTQTKHAGIGDILTINGGNFGTQPGKLCFTTPTHGGMFNNITEFSEATNSFDIVNWSNTQIQVKVPSKVIHSNYGPTNGSQGAGSGPIKIINSNNQECISSTNVNIDYSIINVGGSETVSPKRLNLARMSCDADYVFTLHTSIQNHPQKVAIINAIETALSNWSNLLNISLVLEKDLNNQPIYTSATTNVTKNIIRFDSNFPEGMETDLSFDNCAVNSQLTYYRKNGSNLKIAQNPASGLVWGYQTAGSTSSGEASFYQAFLHELGHIVSLYHVNNSQDLMYWAVSANSPIKNITSTSIPVVAAKTTVLQSKAISWATPNIAKLGTAGLPQPEIGSVSGGSTGICNGNPVNLAVLNSNLYSNVNYAWNTNPIQTSSSISVSTPGTYTVTVSNTMCTKASDPKVVSASTLSATFALTNPTCGLNNGSIIATVTGSNPPYNFKWSKGGGVILGATNNILQGVAEGTYTLGIRDNNGCAVTYNNTLQGSYAKQLHLSLNVNAACKATAIASGGYSPYSYQWSEHYLTISGNYQNPISTAQTISVSCLHPYKNYHYSLVVTDACGTQVSQNVPCCAPSKSTQQNEDSDFVEEIIVYPNPNDGEFSVFAPINTKITIFDVNSKALEATISKFEITNFHLSVAGVYYVKVETEFETIFKKVIIQ
ncbi:MAG: T9SS type A sorting domain-containing protein, partial [Bacteroidales bacterium]|nr:T9SS type A sorting domain-containing protein [Bacteroidales bacterium]